MQSCGQTASEKMYTIKRSHVAHRLYKNAIALGATQVLNTVGSLLLVPLFLSHWSKELYGEWMALAALAAYYSTADVGMNRAAGNALIKAYQRDEKEQYREMQASALLFYISMALAMTLIAVITCWLLPLAKWLGVVCIPRGTAALVMCLLGSRIVWTMPAGQIWNIFRTTGDLSTSQWIVNLQALGIMGATAAVLCLGGGVATLAAWTWCPLFACVFLAWLLVRHSHPDLLPTLRASSVNGVTSLVRPSLWFASMMVAMVINVNGPVILVAHALGGAAVAALVTTRTIANAAAQVPTILCWALWPELTRLEAVGDKVALRSGHNLLVAAYIAISVAFVGCLWWEGQGFIDFWTRRHLSVEPWLVRTFLLYVLLQAPWVASSMVAGATNRHRRLALCQLLGGIGGVVFVAVLLPSLKLVAVPLGLLAGESLTCYHFVIADACRLVKTPYSRFARRVWFTVALVTTLAVSVSAIGHSLPISFLPLRAAASGIASALIAAVGVWKLLLEEPERRLVSECFTRLVRLPAV